MKLEEGRARIITHKELAGTRARSFYFTHRTSYLNFDQKTITRKRELHDYAEESADKAI